MFLRLNAVRRTNYPIGLCLSEFQRCVGGLHRLLRVRIKASKTDPFRVGVDIFVGKTGNKLCPVTAVLSYMVRRGPSPGPFFRFANGVPLTRPRFVAKVKDALAKAGVDAGRYFRSGPATTAAKLGDGRAVLTSYT